MGADAGRYGQTSLLQNEAQSCYFFGYLKAAGQWCAGKILTTGSQKTHAYICVHKFIINFTDMSNTKFIIIKYIISFIVNSIWPVDSHGILSLIFAKLLYL